MIDKHVSIGSVELKKFYDGQLVAKLLRTVRENLVLDCLQGPPKKYGPLIQMVLKRLSKVLARFWQGFATF